MKCNGRAGHETVNEIMLSLECELLTPESRLYMLLRDFKCNTILLVQSQA